MLADHVVCNNCEKEMFVELCTDKCPSCGESGTLSWYNQEEPEVEVFNSEITR